MESGKDTTLVVSRSTVTDYTAQCFIIIFCYLFIFDNTIDRLLHGQLVISMNILGYKLYHGISIGIKYKLSYHNQQTLHS